ncbi:MAG: AraC family transcriptional regulator [Micrococcus sp.]|nr:AraC family transcriptional regulator [Micrococcus sp.]
MRASAAPDPPPPMHHLDSVLHRVRMRGDFYCQAELTAPWALAMPARQDALSFHVVATGECTVQIPGHDDVALDAGDVALVPHGAGHTLRSAHRGMHARDTAVAVERVDLLPQEYVAPSHSRLRYGGHSSGNGESTHLICGVVGFDEAAARELARRLPPVIVVSRRRQAHDSRIYDYIDLMGAELAADRFGGDVMASRLADVIVIEAIRMWMSDIRSDSTRGWFAAVADQHLGCALEAIHREPLRPWTLEDLARRATMSRSTFSARFAELVGETPIAYARRWRVEAAQEALRDQQLSVTDVAIAAGYSSEAAFTRAFARLVGVPPTRWRESRFT